MQALMHRGTYRAQEHTPEALPHLLRHWQLIRFYNMSAKISVVIPTFKRPQLLIACLTALRQQNFSPDDYEIMVITDGPDDRTKTEVNYFVYRHLASNIFLTSLPKKSGPAAARNKGARLAKGELIVFTDDDSIPQPGWLAALWAAYATKQGNELAFTGATIVPRRNKPTDYEKNISHLETAEFTAANCACTKKAFEKVGGFDEDFPAAFREDSDLHFKFISSFIPVIKVEDAVVVHPVRSVPWGISLAEQKKSRYNALLYKKHPALYREKIGMEPLWHYYAIVILLTFAAISYIDDKPLLAGISGICGVLLVGRLVIRRLKDTSTRPGHVLEMIITSIFIPYLSVFWTLYGSLRYKKLYL